MAKGIGINGQFRGRIGGTVYSRLNGQQISRAYNPEVKNPRTSQQLWQRAIMATVMRAYAQGKEIYDHAFEGISFGAANQAEFVRLNARKLRSLVANDVNNATPVAESIARLCAPGVKVAVPNSWIISQGSLQQNFFSIIPAHEETVQGVTTHVPAKVKIPGALNQDETIAEYCTRLGLVPGEIFTIVALAYDDSEGTNYVYAYDKHEALACIYESYFGFVRLTVKSDALTDTDPIYDTELSSVFDLDISTNITKLGWLVNDAIDEGEGISVILQNCFSINGFKPAYVGIIRSNEDSKLRSNTELVFAGTTEHDALEGYGLAYPYVIPAWKKGTEKLGTSDRILEGGSF